MHPTDAGTAIIVHLPAVPTHDLDPDSKAGLVNNSTAPPAVRVDGEPVPTDRGRRVRIPVAPGEHLVEAMVKQSYASVPVTLARGRTTEVHIDHRRRKVDGDDLFAAGGKDYVKGAMDTNPVWGNSVGCGLLLLPVGLIGFAAAAAAFADEWGMGAGAAAVSAIAAAVLLAGLGAVIAGLTTRSRALPDLASAAPPLEMPGGAASALVLPTGVEPPRRPGLVLRVRARPRTLNMIGFAGRTRDPARAGSYEFYFNEAEDWVSAPRVWLDGVELGAAWGTWWIPAGAGPHRLRVEFDDIGGHRLDGFTAETDVAVERTPREVEAHFNFIEMAAQRAEAGGALSRWQRIMRRTGHDADMTGQAANEPGVEFTVR